MTRAASLAILVAALLAPPARAADPQGDSSGDAPAPEDPAQGEDSAPADDEQKKKKKKKLLRVEKPRGVWFRFPRGYLSVLRGVEPGDLQDQDGTWRPRTIALLPSIAYNPDDGLGLGIFGDVLWNARPGDQRPHWAQLSVKANAWIKPKQLGWEGFFGFSFFPRAEGDTEITSALSTFGRFWDWWFGVGPGIPRDRSRQRGWHQVNDYYHRFGHFRIRLDLHGFRRFVGPLDFFAGTAITWNQVLVRDGTQLAEDLPDLQGTEGGFTYSLDGGLRVDTRDWRIDPLTGGYVLGLGQINLGPERPWGRFTFDLRGYQGLADGKVVFAGELLLLAGLGPVPFYELGVVPGYEFFERKMTGQFGLRGLDRGRLRGRLGAHAKGELRLRPPGFTLLDFLVLRISPVFWADVVRVDEPPDIGGGWVANPAFGGGIRIFWNEVTVSRLDLGTGPEPLITAEGDERVRWTFAVYGTVGQAF